MPAGRENRRLGLLISLGLGIGIACLVLSIAYVSLWRGDHDGLKHAVGRDFINLWTASQLIEADRALDIFDQDKFAAAQRQQLGPDFPFHFWSYPPHTLLLSLQLSNLPYRGAFAVWTLSGLFVMLYAAYLFWPAKIFPCLLLLAPSSFVNFFLGQNGFVTAALALGGFAMLPRRPIVAGIMFGLLTFKPHLGIMIPIALVALRQWPAIAAAFVSAALFIGASVLMYGADVWWQFLQSTLPYQMRFIAAGEGPFQWMMPSWFMAGRIIGLPLWLSQTIQAARGHRRRRSGLSGFSSTGELAPAGFIAVRGDPGGQPARFQLRHGAGFRGIALSGLGGDGKRLAPRRIRHRHVLLDPAPGHDALECRRRAAGSTAIGGVADLPVSAHGTRTRPPPGLTPDAAGPAPANATAGADEPNSRAFPGWPGGKKWR